MEFLKALESIRNPFFDWFFSLITHIGDETVFLAVAILVFWCVSKREGFYLLVTGFVGTIVNGLLKLFYRVPRPWVKDPTFKPVESAIERATGYSFPSGHTQNVTGTFGAIAMFTKRWIARGLFILVILLVAFSRMYLGVHTPLDVLTSLGIGAVLVFALRPLFKNDERFEKFMPYVIMGVLLLTTAFMLYFPITRETVAHDAANLESGLENAYTLAGCAIGLAIVYFADVAYVKFDTRATWYVQIIKFAVGLGLVILIKEGLRNPLIYICGENEYIARMIRYLLVVVFAGIIWPFFFRYLTRIKSKTLDKLGAKVAKIFGKSDTDATVDAEYDAMTASYKNKPTYSRISYLEDGSRVYTPKRKKKASRKKK